MTAKPNFKIRDVLAARSDLSAIAGVVSVLDYVNSIVSNGNLETVRISGTILSNGTTIVDSTHSPLTLILPDAVLYGMEKELTLQPVSGNTVIVQTSNGSFALDSYTTYRHLVFTNNGWKLLSNRNSSFFPSNIQTTEPSLVGSHFIGTNIGMGGALALASDSNTLAFGGPGDELQAGPLGATWIFIHDPLSRKWIQQAKLVGTDYLADMSGQGFSIALSADGSTLAVGGPTDNLMVGAIWIFVRTGGLTGHWSQQAKIVAPDGILTSTQGTSVALSTDGNTLAFGGDGDNGGIGAVWIYTRSNSVWTKMQKIVPNNVIGTANVGVSVALSANGSVLAFGGNNDHTNIGAVWIYTLINSVYTEQTKIIAPDSIGTANQGGSVTLSSDGLTLGFGGIADNNYIGAVWIYIYTNSSWTEQTKLVSTGVIGNSSKQGTSLSFSGDGNTLAIGAPDDDSYLGATFIWTREGTIWIQRDKLIVEGTVPNANGHVAQGSSVCLSSNGNALAIGSIADRNLGSVAIFN